MSHKGIVLLMCTIVALTHEAGAAEASGAQWVFFGTYTGGKSKGIYRAEFDPATGKLSPAVLAIESPSPSFLAVHPSGNFLYSVNEVGGKNGGAVSAYAV